MASPPTPDLTKPAPRASAADHATPPARRAAFVMFLAAGWLPAAWATRIPAIQSELGLSAGALARRDPRPGGGRDRRPAHRCRARRAPRQPAGAAARVRGVRPCARGRRARRRAGRSRRRAAGHGLREQRRRRGHERAGRGAGAARGAAAALRAPRGPPARPRRRRPGGHRGGGRRGLGGRRTSSWRPRSGRAGALAASGRLVDERSPGRGARCSRAPAGACCCSGSSPSAPSRWTGRRTTGAPSTCGRSTAPARRSRRPRSPASPSRWRSGAWPATGSSPATGASASCRRAAPWPRREARSSSWRRAPRLALAGWALFGLGLAAVAPTVLGAAPRAGDAPPAVAIAAVTTIGYLGSFTAPPLVGALAEASSLSTALAVLVVVAALLVVLARPALGARGEEERRSAASAPAAS